MCFNRLVIVIHHHVIVEKILYDYPVEWQSYCTIDSGVNLVAIVIFDLFSALGDAVS